MGCANSKDRVERTSPVAADSFVVASDMQKLQLQQALDKGSFLFTQERSASAEAMVAASESRPTLASTGGDVEPIGNATCTSDYASGEDIDLQLKQVRQPCRHARVACGLCCSWLLPQSLRRAQPPETQKRLRCSAQGDIVVLVERIDSTWLRGYVEGNPTVIGFFPANFVRETGAADGGGAEEEQDSVAHEDRTLWVGSIPENQATQQALKEVFAAFGPLDNITVRKKETAEHGPNKSWCFVSYKAADSAQKAVVETITMQDEAGAGVQLRVREPNLVAELSKPTTGALGGIWENHKSLLGAAMKVDLQQEGDGITAGMTMGKIEKALDLVPTGRKADKSDSADWEDQAKEGSFETKKEAKVASASFRKIKQISRDFEASRSQDFEDTEKLPSAHEG
jgi:hypothetical protein